VSRLRASEGALLSATTAAAAQAKATLHTLAAERASDLARQQHVTALVTALRDQV